jgi:hypothetical protein
MIILLKLLRPPLGMLAAMNRKLSRRSLNKARLLLVKVVMIISQVRTSVSASQTLEHRAWVKRIVWVDANLTCLFLLEMFVFRPTLIISYTL